METGDKIYPVILSGGAGTRLWPLSTKQCPKQFLKINSEKPLIVETAERFLSEYFHPPTIVSGQDYRFLVAQALQDEGITPLSILLEPLGRNTAAAIAVASLAITRGDPDATLVVLPSDHVIEDVDVFLEAIHEAVPSATNGHIVTFGVVPDSPNTGYGYIKKGGNLASGSEIYRIDKFVEKPIEADAERMLGAGGYYWNSGIFLFKASVVLAELGKWAPDILTHAEKSVTKSLIDMDFTRLDAKSFEKIPAMPFDIAVMEKTSKGVVAPVDMGWSDIGSWAALHDKLESDENNNVCVGASKQIDTKNSLVWSEAGITTSVIGMEDMLVVSTKDHVLVSRIDDLGRIGNLAKKIQLETGFAALTAAKFYRPWGYYQTIDSGDTYQTKRLVIRPGARLSLQYHNHRSEHWVVVQGTATVTRDDETFELLENESTYIPAGHQHRLENKQNYPLILIEVQTGAILSENDIVRLSDDWGRLDDKDKNEN